MAHEKNGSGGRHAAATKLFQAARRESEPYTSKAWGLDLELRGMSMGEYAKLMTEAYTPGATPEAPRVADFAKLYPMVLRFGCYVDGEAILAGVPDEEINALALGEVKRVVERILALSALDKEEEQALGKGSGGTTTSTSATRSPATSGAR